MGVAHEFISRMRKYKEKSAKLQVFTLNNDFFYCNFCISCTVAI